MDSDQVDTTDHPSGGGLTNDYNNNTFPMLKHWLSNYLHFLKMFDHFIGVYLLRRDKLTSYNNGMNTAVNRFKVMLWRFW